MSNIYFSSFLSLSIFYLNLFFVISDQRLRELIYTMKEESYNQLTKTAQHSLVTLHKSIHL
jgi:hypothetical protein